MNLYVLKNHAEDFCFPLIIEVIADKSFDGIVYERIKGGRRYKGVMLLGQFRSLYEPLTIEKIHEWIDV
jgi:hypothetical protein